MEGRQLSNVKIGGYSVNELKDTAGEYYDDLQVRFKDVDSRVRDVVNARPLVAVFGAFTVGFLFARAMRMWRN